MNKPFELKSITFREFILLCAIAVLIVLSVRQCNKPKPKPEYIPIKEQVKVVERDEAAMRKQADSFMTIINIQDRTNAENYNDLVDFANENSRLQADIMALSKAVPDTCKQYVAQYQRYASQTSNTINAANKTISGLNTTIGTQRKFLDAKDSAYARLKNSWDTCIATAIRLEDYSKSIKPKREISAGLTGMYNYVGEIVPGVGIQLGYRSRKGIEITASVYTNQVITIGIKKSIFKF